MDDTALLDQLLDPLTRCFDSESARRLVEFQVSPALQARVDALAQRANDGQLSDAERADYDALITAAEFIAVLKLKARRSLQSSPER